MFNRIAHGKVFSARISFFPGEILKKLNILHLTEVGVGKVLSGMNKRIDNEFILNNIQSMNDIG